MIHPFMIACEAHPEGIGHGPMCRAGEAEGAAVGVITVARCEGYFARPDDLDDLWSTLASKNWMVYGAYRDPGLRDQFIEGRDSRYDIVFGGAPTDFTPDPAPTGSGLEIVTDDVGIFIVNFDCGLRPNAMVEAYQLTDAIIAPASR